MIAEPDMQVADKLDIPDMLIQAYEVKHLSMKWPDLEEPLNLR